MSSLSTDPAIQRSSKPTAVTTTPMVIRLMVNILFAPDRKLLTQQGGQKVVAIRSRSRHGRWRLPSLTNTGNELNPAMQS